MYSKKTLTLLACIAGAALLVAYWKEISGFFSGKIREITDKKTLTQADDKATTDTGSNASSTNTTPNAGANTSGKVSFTEILKRGSKGASVILLQQLLNGGWKKGLVVDGAFGTKTEAALHQVTNQYSMSLNSFVNGYVNPNSQAYAIFKTLQP